MTETWKKRTVSVATLFCFCVFVCPTFGRDGDVQTAAPNAAEATLDDASSAPTPSEGEAGEAPTSPPKMKINANPAPSRGANAMLERAVSTVGALAITLGVFVVLFLLTRAISRKSFLGANAGGDMVEILDVARLDAKTELRTIRWQGTQILVARGSSGWVKLGERPEDARESD